MDYKLLHQILSKSENLSTSEKPKKSLIFLSLIISILIPSFLIICFDSYLLIQLIIGLFLLLIYLVAVFRNAFHIAILLPSVFLGQLCSSLLVYTYILLSFSPNLSFFFVSLLIAIILSGIVFRRFYALAPLKVQLNLRQLYKTLNVSLLSLLGMFFIYSVYLECTQVFKTLALYDRIFVYLICLALYVYYTIFNINFNRLIHVRWDDNDTREYALYLRSFDLPFVKEYKVITSIKHAIQNLHMVKVGDPRELFGMSVGEDVYYLPDADWKKHVYNLVVKAKYVFLNIDCPKDNNQDYQDNRITEGVIWEICNHVGYNYKMMYHLCDVRSLDMNQIMKYKSTIIFRLIDYVQHNLMCESCWIKIFPNHILISRALDQKMLQADNGIFDLVSDEWYDNLYEDFKDGNALPIYDALAEDCNKLIGYLQ